MIDHESRALVAEIKDRVRIPQVWHALGLEGTPATSCRAPWREDRKPSFSVFDDGKAWKDHSSEEGGDVFSFTERATGMDFANALQWLAGLAGLPVTGKRRGFTHPRVTNKTPFISTKGKTSSSPPVPPTLPELDEGTVAEWMQVGESRRLTPYTVTMAVEMGAVRFGSVGGFRSWILLDRHHGHCAEARRIDGKPFPAIGSLPERKAHTLKGSSKSWPLGLPPANAKGNFSILLVEGTPDFLAVLHFQIVRRDWPENHGQDFIPVAMLGRGNKIDPAALPYFTGRKVRIIPHIDKDDGGIEAAQRWAQQIAEASPKEISSFSLEGLRRRDGKPVSDLNDAVLIHPDEQSEITTLFP